MFDIELIEIVLKSKEDRLHELQPQATTNKVEIENITKEINQLKLTITRYKIAKLFKLDTDSKYISMNFLGIEEENVDSFNLSPEEINEYNNLIVQIPSKQLSKYKIRREMANILGSENSESFKDNDYIGIEKTNPSLVKYELNQEKIDKFIALANQLQSLGEDDTKKVDVVEEAKKILQDAFNKLNIEDTTEYNRVKNIYLKTIDKIITHLDDNTKNSLFTGVSNYELVSDLTEKYPDLKVGLDIKGVEYLLRTLETPRIEEDKYNRGIEILCQNISSLYSSDSNKSDIENLLNGIQNTNYTLRSDLNKNLPNIENVSLRLQDAELAPVVSYLDSNYTSLDKVTREKIYALVVDKISKEIANVNKAKDINKIILGIKNRELADRLQKELSKNENIEFNNQHVSSYDALLQEAISKLEKKKSKYQKKKFGNATIKAHYDTRIKEIEKEIEELKSIKASYDNNVVLKRLNSSYNKKSDKITDIKREIEELKELRSKVTTSFHQKIVDRQIERRNKRIKHLQKSKNKIVGVQKKIMTPKLWLNKKKGLINRHFEAKTEVFNEYANNYKEMANAERQLNGMLSGIKAKFYEFKEKRYTNKAKFNQSVCDMLKKGKVTVKGRNKKKINKNTLNQIRQNQQQQLQQSQGKQLSQAA